MAGGKIKKTYSRKTAKEKTKKRIRKNLPKFEDLFLNRASIHDSSSYLFENKEKPSSETKHYSTDETSLNDSFDKLCKGLKLSVKSIIKKNSLLYGSSGSSNTKTDSSTADLFSPEMKIKSLENTFSSYLFSEPVFDKKFTKLKKLNNQVKDDPSKISHNSKKFTSPISQLSNKLQPSSELTNGLYTSTPVVNNYKSNFASSKDNILMSALSPVLGDLSLNGFEHNSSANLMKKESLDCKNSFENCNTKFDLSPSTSCFVKPCSVKLNKLSPELLGSLYSNLENSIELKASKVTRRRKVKEYFGKEMSGSYSFSSSKCVLGNINGRKLTSTVSTSFRKQFCHNSCIQHSKSWRGSLNKFSRSVQVNKSMKYEDFNLVNWRRSHHLDISIINLSTNKEVFIPEDHAKNFVLSLCNQTEYIPLSHFYNDSVIGRSKKIGEGVYGEVFLTYINDLESMCHVSKLIPIEGDIEVNGEPQKTFSEICSEIVISINLSKLNEEKGQNYCPNFVKVKEIRCLQGNYFKKLLDLWDAYDTDKGSENDRPDMFPDNQIYIMMLFENAGRDLESFIFTNATQACELFNQVAYGLAAAEMEYSFEHRDLHWGNVLVATTSETKLQYKIDGTVFTLPTKGVKAKIIDFTLSRLTTNGCIYFYDLSKDPTMFTGEGDLQFDIYRNMKEVNGDDWREYTPKTNIHWLSYICYKMINDCYYKNIKTKIHKQGIKQLKAIQNDILYYDSAYSYVLDRETSA